MDILSDDLIIIKNALNNGDKEYAREMLKEKLAKTPTADAWYLASVAATNHTQRSQFLQKALDLDPFHEQASSTLERLNKESSRESQSIKPKSNSRSIMLAEAVTVFTQNDWELKLQVNDMVQMEKRKPVNSFAAFLVIVIFNFIGALIVVAGIATSKREKVTLQLEEDGMLRVTGSKTSFIARDGSDVVTLANSVKNGVTYAGVLGLCVFSLFIWVIIS